MRSSTLILFLSSLLFAACGDDTQAGEKPEKPGYENPTDQPGADKPGAAMAAKVYDVKCGCAISADHECGNYIVVDGKPLELTGNLVGLGDMEFCPKQGKEEGLRAEVAGKVEGDKFVATSFKLVQ